MAATSYTLTGDFADILGTDFVIGNAKKIVAWVVANTDTISDPVGNVVRTGTQSITVAADGTFSVSLWATNDTTLNPTAFQYKVHWRAVGAHSLKPVSDDSGWFSLTANTNLADVIEEQYVPPTWLTTVTASLASYVTDAQTAETNAEAAQAAAEAARDDAVDISSIATPDALVQDLVLNTGGAGPLTSAALSATFATLIQQAKDPDGIIQGAITRGATGAVTSAGVVWNDGATGTYTADSIDSTGAVLGYHITHVVGATTTTYTQPTMTRDGTGAVTNRPAIVVS